MVNVVRRSPSMDQIALLRAHPDLAGKAACRRALAEISGAFFLCVILFVMVYEEPTLRHKFGAEYEAYCRRVPGWIPRFRNKLN